VGSFYSFNKNNLIPDIIILSIFVLLKEWEAVLFYVNQGRSVSELPRRANYVAKAPGIAVQVLKRIAVQVI